MNKLNKKLQKACNKLYHWHDWGKNNEGMVVSAEVVHEIWAVMAQMDRQKSKRKTATV